MHPKIAFTVAVAGAAAVLTLQAGTALAAQAPADNKPAANAPKEHGADHSSKHMKGMKDHMDQKAGADHTAPAQPPADAAKPKKKDPAQDRSKHFHPRDGKA